MIADSRVRREPRGAEGLRQRGLRGGLRGVLFLGLAIDGCAGVEPKPRGAPAPPAPGPAASTRLAGPFDWSEAVVYFVLIDRFADGDPGNNRNVDVAQKGTFHGGDLRGLTAHLEEIASLGVNAIWINPIVQNVDGFVTGAGFPDWAYHGYWADDFTRLDPRFGTEDDLVRFVNACHTRGIRVLLDVVYNHAGYGSRYLKDPKTKGWLRSSEAGTCGEDDVTTCVAGLPDFRTEQPEVADFLLTSQLAWAKRYGLDGFRIDTVKHLDHAFWAEHRKRIRAEIGAGFFLLGEVWGGDRSVLDPWFQGDELDAGFDFGFQGSAIGWAKGRGRTVAFDRYLTSREKVRKGFQLSHFLSSHDTPGALFQLEGDKQLFWLTAVLQMTTAGIPTIYYGEEVGRPGGDWPDNRSDMPWGSRAIAPGAGQPRDEALRSRYARLIDLRRRHPALWRGSHQGLHTDGDVYVFARRDPVTNAVVLVALNRGETSATVRVPAPVGWAGKTVHGELSALGASTAGPHFPPMESLLKTPGPGSHLPDTSHSFTGDGLDLTLQPRAAEILTAR